jgi:hypothetical protein
MTSNFMIGPIKDGLRKDIKPFATPEDSFDNLLNAFQFRGRIIRREGYRLLGQLQVVFTIPGGTVLAGGSINLLTAFGLSTSYRIIPGTINITDVNQAQIYTDPNKDGILIGSLGGTGTINYMTGALTITGGAGDTITGTFGYATGLPVMGLKTKEGFAIGVQAFIGFDTINAYTWNGTNFFLLPSIMPVTWSGTDSQFFFTTNYADAFWVTNSKPGLNGWIVTLFAGSAGVGNTATVNVTAPGNTVAVNDFVYFLNITGVPAVNNLIYAIVTAIIVPGTSFTVEAQNATATFMFANGVPTTGMVLDAFKTVSGQDGIRYYGILQNGTGWANYNPPLNGTAALAGALMIFPYRGYLVFLNTTEGNDQGTNNFGNRARWTQIGTPYYSFPVPQNPNLQGIDFNAARDDLFGRGGANDAPTSEVIVGAEFIRDILIVYFERSTWRLRFVNNAQNPFIWERINVELGADCTFSTIVFDKGLMAIGNRGIVISDGNDTSRFDEKIPDQFFNIRQANQGLQRVYGIRTFKTKLNYWTFGRSTNPNGTFPDQVLVFNYDTKNWALFDDSFTCFGYQYESTPGKTWGDLPDAWSSYTNISWDSGVSESNSEEIVAGNQQGYVFELETNGMKNDPSLSIANITAGAAGSPATFTSTNHNLFDQMWVTLTGVTGSTSDDGVSLNGRNFKVVDSTLNANTFTLQEFKPINGGNAVGTSYAYTIGYNNILAGSAQIDIGALSFKDPRANGILVEANLLGTGTINYSTGAISLSFTPAILSTTVYIRVVSLDTLQGLSLVNITGTYTGGGQIARISGIDIQTKFFNFLGQDQRARLSKIDFYMDSTTSGQFTTNIFMDSSNEPGNTPLSDNLLSNIVLTSVNPYQFGQGDETIFRLYADVVAQTIQAQITFSDQQMAVNAINQSDIQLLSMIFGLRKGGRLV